MVRISSPSHPVIHTHSHKLPFARRIQFMAFQLLMRCYCKRTCVCERPSGFYIRTIMLTKTIIAYAIDLLVDRPLLTSTIEITVLVIPAILVFFQYKTNRISSVFLFLFLLISLSRIETINLSRSCSFVRLACYYSI